MVEFVSSSSDDVEYLLVCDEDYREHLYFSLLHTASEKLITPERYLNRDVFCNQSLVFNNLQPDTNYTLIMNFGGEGEEEEEEMNCTNITTFQTKSRNPSGKIIIFLLIAEWNNIIVHSWVWVCVEWGLSKWMGLGVDECEVNCLVSTFMMLHLLW